MKEEIKKLEIQIEGLELERNRLMRTYKAGELALNPFDQVRALNSQILQLSHKLNELRMRNPLKYDVESSAKPNPVELIATWCDLFGFMMALTWFCGGISMYLHGGGVGFTIFGIGLFMLLIGIPGMLVGEILGAVKNRFGEIMPTYYCSESLFASGIKGAFRRCWDNFGVGMFLTVFLTVWTMIGNLTCFFNPDAFTLSVIGILFLSFGGFFAIGAKIALDVRRGTRKARQVF